MTHAGPRPSAAAAYRVPAQPGVADVDRERGRGASAADAASGGAGGDPVRRDPAPATDEDACRGEHTHSETPIPLPWVGGAGVEQRGHGAGGPGRAVEVEDGRRSDGAARPVVQRASVRGQILDALRAALAGGELTPGEVYSAPALGERFGVSATPVRESMQQLAMEGAVEVVPNRGFRVVRRGARELAELAEVRALLQVPVLLRLARTMPAERWAELRPLAEETARAASSGRRATYGEADRAFHRGMLALGGNEQLVQIADDLHRRTQLPLSVGSAAGTRLELLADAAEHIALLDALAAGDLEAVECLIGNHFGGAL